MSIGSLRRKLNVDLLNRMRRGWKPEGKTLSERSSTSVMAPRAADTYRAARRNSVKMQHGVWGKHCYY